MSCEDVTQANDALIAALSGPLRVSGDAGSVEQRSVADLIMAANYLAGRCAARGRSSGLRFTRLVPDGAVMGRGDTTSPFGDFNHVPWFR